MTVTQALEQRKLLIKQIFFRIERAEFIGLVKESEDNSVKRSMEVEEWRKKAKNSWEEILEQIERYQKLNEAIIVSDAVTQLMTNFGEFTVAAALSLKRRLEGYDFNGVELEFEEILLRKIRAEYREKAKMAEANLGELADAYGILTKAEELREKKNVLLAELTTQIHLSNAATWITIEGGEKDVSTD